MYVACDTTPNLLYHNNHDGTFTEIGKTAGVAYSEEGSMQAGMGALPAAYPTAGYDDIVKSNFTDETRTIFLKPANKTFERLTHTIGPGSIQAPAARGVR